MSTTKVLKLRLGLFADFLLIRTTRVKITSSWWIDRAWNVSLENNTLFLSCRIGNGHSRSGEELLLLAERPGIEEIVADFEVEAQ